MSKTPSLGPLFLKQARPVPSILAGWLVSRLLLSPLRSIEIEPFVLMPGFAIVLLGLAQQTVALNRGIVALRPSYLLIGVILDAWAWWALRPGTGAAIVVTGPWDMPVVVLSAVSLALGLVAMLTLGIGGGPQVVRQRWFPGLGARLAVAAGCLGSVVVYRISFITMADLPNEERSLMVAGCEIHHGYLGAGLLVAVLALLATRRVRPGWMVMLVFGLAAGSILDQLSYLMLSECSDEAYGSLISEAGAIAGVALLGALVFGDGRWRAGGRGVQGSAEKLLSHRLRGFSEFEHSLSSLVRATRSTVRYLEVDTRTSSDGQIVLYHDPITGPEVSQRTEIATSTADELRGLRFVNGDSLLTLERALAVFSEGPPEQMLCVDIKDHGMEEAHLHAVREARLEHRVCWVSWIPQTLLRLRELGATSPLVLSHLNLLDLGAARSWITGRLGDAPICLGRTVVLGERAVKSPLVGLERGFQHAFICGELPQEVQETLAASGGGICVPKALVGSRLIRYAQERDLEVWSFSVIGPRAFERQAGRAGVDVVFCDDAASLST